MAFFPVVGELVQARTCQYTPTQISLNVVHFRVTATTGTGASLTEIASDLDGQLASAYKALMSDTAKWRGVGCVAVGPPRTIEYAAVTNDGAGTVVGILLPTQTSYLIQKRTNVAGRGFLGRVYPGFPPITATSAGGTMNGTFVATLQLLVDIMNAWLPTFGVIGATGDTTLKPVLRHAAGSTYDIDEFRVAPRFATQRRRGQFGRVNSLPF